MPYLSRLRINPLRAQSRALLANPRIMHSFVCAGVPDTPQTQRLLWRLDTQNPHRPQLLVLTQSKPDWTHLIEAAGWPNSDGEHAAVADYAPLLAQLALGREFTFRLTANPVQNTKRPDKPTPAQKERLKQNTGIRSFRLGHRTPAAQLGWLLDRTAKHGFAIPPALVSPGISDLPNEPITPAADVRLIHRARVSFHKKADGRQVTLHTATFDGRLKVTDVELLTQALLRGIGPAKAYGCGLLTLAPLRR